jgi:hypothetical protein
MLLIFFLCLEHLVFDYYVSGGSSFSFLNFNIVLLDIFFIYISNVIPFPGLPSENPLLSPLPLAHQPTHSHFLALAFPYTGTYNLHKTKSLSSH